MSESLITLLFEMLLYKPILLPQQPEYWPEVSLVRGETSMTGQEEGFWETGMLNIKMAFENGAPTDCLNSSRKPAHEPSLEDTSRRFTDTQSSECLFFPDSLTSPALV